MNANIDECKKLLNVGTTIMGNPVLQVPLGGIIDKSLIALNDGPIWKAHRKAVMAGLNPNQLNTSANHAHFLGLTLCKLWEPKMINGEITVEVSEIMRSLLVDLLGIVTLGKSFDVVGQTRKEVDSKHFLPLGEFSQIFTGRFLIPRPLWQFFGLATHNPKVKNLNNTINDFMTPIFDAAAAELEKSPSKEKKTIAQDIYLAYSQGLIDYESMIHETMLVFVGGQVPTNLN
jgi:cytochrome P450